MKTIGLVGESHNDKTAIANLLGQKFSKHVSFKPLLKKFKGAGLNNEDLKRLLKSELEADPLDNVIFIKDTDCMPSETAKIKEVEKWFAKLNKLSGNIGVLLKNIYELEALIFADIETFNRLYKTTIKDDKNVHFIKEPKELLKEKTRKGKKQYKESDCPVLFTQLRYDIVKANSTLFRDFEKEFCKAAKVSV